MPADRLLATVLRAYQAPQPPDQANRILSTTTSLLTTLSNPLNVTLLASQLLTAPAVWTQRDALEISFRIISIFNTAAITVLKHEQERQDTHTLPSQDRGGIGCDEWAKAVVKGADEKSPRWKHVLVICGVLLGMESQDRRGLSLTLRSTLESAIVNASNLALADVARDGIFGAEAVVLALNHAFPLLSDFVRASLDYDSLAPVLLRAMTGGAGFEGGQFIGGIDVDVKRAADRKLDWSLQSPSFLNVRRISSKPLISSMGPLSRLTAHAINNLRCPDLLEPLTRDLTIFTASLMTQWRQTKLSAIDASEEAGSFSSESQQQALPLLWQVLKNAMFATVVILNSVVSRTLVDPKLAGRAVSIAKLGLHSLRNTYFISSRLGPNAFSSYIFVSLASIDLLSQFPTATRSFLTEIRPPHTGHIPVHPLDRILDLYYLNTVEHFTMLLRPVDGEHFVFAAASPYLHPNTSNMRELFEAAHGAVLALMAAPQNAEMTARILPSYIEALFASFPGNLSTRQFRFAFKTLLQITSPPSPLSASHPLLADTLVELLHQRATHASNAIIPPVTPDEIAKQSSSEAVSEQAALVLTLIDGLPYLPLSSLEERLPITAQLLVSIQDARMAEMCRSRLWEVLENGEMDVERAAICVAWWTTRGGRRMVLKSGELAADEAVMSGALSTRDGSRL